MRVLTANEATQVAGAGLLNLNANLKVALRPLAAIGVKAKVDLLGSDRGGCGRGRGHTSCR